MLRPYVTMIDSLREARSVLRPYALPATRPILYSASKDVTSVSCLAGRAEVLRLMG